MDSIYTDGTYLRNNPDWHADDSAWKARHIVATVRNKLEQRYPSERLEVIVISDASSDGTDELVAGIDDPRVRLLRQQPAGENGPGW